jgi:hypothetical protein
MANINLSKFLSRLDQEQAELRIIKDDVFGPNGMVVANSEEVCPIFGDKVPYKSVTVVVPELSVHDGLIGDVEYWLDFVQGDGSVSQRRSMPDGTVALRSDYMAW